MLGLRRGRAERWNLGRDRHSQGRAASVIAPAAVATAQRHLRRHLCRAAAFHQKCQAFPANAAAFVKAQCQAAPPGLAQKRSIQLKHHNLK